jgi:hypothetical protein
MPQSSTVFVAACACGRVAFEARGEPITSVACYCASCRTAALQIEAMPNGQSGMGADGGTLSLLYRKDRVRCVRGSDLLIEHKLSPTASTRRVVSACCHCSLTARLGRWFPHVPLRSFAADALPIVPRTCLFTKHALHLAPIAHSAPRHGGVPLHLLFALGVATFEQVVGNASAPVV